MGGATPCRRVRAAAQVRRCDLVSGPRSWPPRLVGWWRHTHEFNDGGDGTTLVRDRVDTRCRARRSSPPSCIGIVSSPTIWPHTATPPSM
ncbi:hypothetical protein I552_7224 [Mycobacterium xenopi 3993]|nr:hypothetical protein I552_7224 [Mycobacterium xenopi 3993]